MNLYNGRAFHVLRKVFKNGQLRYILIKLKYFKLNKMILQHLQAKRLRNLKRKENKTGI